MVHPIGHHTSHTMGNGASSSSSGDNGNGGHHTSHTMANGASSSNGAAHGGGAGSRVAGTQDAGLEASLTRTSSDVQTTDIENEDNNEHEPLVEDEDEDDDSAVESLSSSQSEAGTGTFSSAATSMYSAGTRWPFAIIDSTLREGDQFATAYYTTETKLKIARALDDFGAEYIELTNPAASKQSFEDCKAICKLGLKTKVLCHIRCHMHDARLAVECGVSGINMCIGTSKQLMEHSHGKDFDYIERTAKEIIHLAHSNNIEIRFTGEDSFRSDFNDILKLYSLMDSLGANRVGIADTVGGATPMEVYRKISELRRTVKCDIETHFHNDTGCANANALMAIEAGATHIDTTVLGIGERNGITSIRGLLATIVPRDREYIYSKYRVDKLQALEDLVAETVSIKAPWNNFPIVTKEY